MPQAVFRKQLLLLTAAVASATAGCAPTRSLPPTPYPPSNAAAAAAVPQVKVGSFGFDVAGMDLTVAPGDDFFRYANGGWHDRAEIPADKSRIWVFGELRDAADARVFALLEDAAAAPGTAGTDRQRVGDYFASLLDEETIERRGLSPLAPGLDRITSVRSPADVARALAWMSSFRAVSPLALGVGPNRRGEGEQIVVLGQSGAALGAEYYTSSDPAFRTAREKYQAHIAGVFRLLGLGEAEARAARVYDFERRIASAHWSLEDTRNPDKARQNWSRNELTERAPGFDWDAYLAEAGLEDQKLFSVVQPSAVASIAHIVGSEPVSVLQDYLRLRYVGKFVEVLPKAFRDESFRFYGVVLGGLEQPSERRRAVKPLLDTYLGVAIGKLYVERHVTAQTESQAAELVANLRLAMRRRIEIAEWMSPQTKRNALTKLEAMNAKLLHPRRWEDYSGLEVVRGDAFGNHLRASQFEQRRQFAKLGRPFDREEWLALPYEVNAYNAPARNVLGFPAGLFEAPFFDPAADPAVNYGAVGVFIGHEMSHGFDDQGRKYDERGLARNWWSAEDAERYQARVEPLVRQFASYEPLPGLPINGRASLGENIADLAGLQVAYDAYVLSLKGRPAPIIDGFSGEQRFFLAFAQVWRSKMREAALRRHLGEDTHTPTHYRPYTVRNMDEWYTAFKVAPGNKYYLPPEQRVRVW